MPIPLNDERAPSTPVVKRQRIGDRFVGAIVRTEQRDVLKKNDTTQQMERVLKPNGKAKQELVVHCLTMPKNTAPAGLGGELSVPEPGSEVRLILRGGAFGDWIEARKGHRKGALNVGDVVVMPVEYAQAWTPDGAPKGPKITDQAEADAIPRGTSVGFYGPLSLHEPKEQEWVDAAERAYQRQTAVVLDAGPAIDDTDEPF